LHSVERCFAWYPLAGGRADLVSQRPGRRSAGACRSLRPTPATVEKRHCRLRLAMPCGACHVALGVAALPAVPMLAFCRLLLFTTALFCGLATAADPNSVDPGGRQLDADQLALINRITWGATPQVVQTFLRAGHQRYIDDQLKPGDPQLPAAVQKRLDAMKLGSQPVEAS